MLQMLQPLLVSLGVLSLFDVVARLWLHPLRKPEHTRWCAVHAAVNVLVAMTAFPSLMHVHVDPLASGDSALATVLAMTLHLYHVVAYDLSTDDRVHHLLFVAIMGVPSLFHHLRGTNALVAAQRCGKLLRFHERSVSALVNLGLRTPGVLYVLACFTSQAVVALPIWVAAMQIVLPIGNVFYYSWQSVSRLL